MKRIILLFTALIVFIPNGFLPLYAQTKKVIKVGLVTDIGKIDDHTFNEMAYKGMMRAGKAFKLKTAFIETLQPTDYEKNIEQFISEGYSVVITVGFMLGDATKKMATKYPDVKFIIVDYAFDPSMNNVLGLLFAEKEGGFLAGALAGLTTRSKTVGVVAGKSIPPVVRWRKGYEAGVKYACPKCEVLSVHIDSFIDPARGKTAALSQMDEGADIIFGAGGVTGSGAIMGAAQRGAFVIGVDQDEYLSTFKEGKAPRSEKIISSAIKRVDNAVYQAIQAIVEGKFKGGVAVSNLQNNGIGLAPFHKAESKIPDNVRQKLQKITEDLKSGKIKVD